MTNADKNELRRLCKAGDSRTDEEIARVCDCSPATVKRYRKHIKPQWYVDRTRGVPGFSFAVCAPYRDGLGGTAVLGCFSYRPHAEAALVELKRAEEAGEFKAMEKRG